jgi:hypothetical protein
MLEQNSRDATIQQQKLIIENQQRENLALKEMLASRGIPFEGGLESRKVAMGMRPKREDNSLTPPSMATLSPPSIGGRPLGYHTVVPGPPSTSTGYSPQYLNGTGSMSVSGHSPGTTQHSHSPYSGPDVQEFGIKQERGAIPDMPGIFEKEPQLGIDFILKFVTDGL